MGERAPLEQGQVLAGVVEGRVQLDGGLEAFGGVVELAQRQRHDAGEETHARVRRIGVGGDAQLVQRFGVAPEEVQRQRVVVPDGRPIGAPADGAAQVPERLARVAPPQRDRAQVVVGVAHHAGQLRRFVEPALRAIEVAGLRVRGGH